MKDIIGYLLIFHLVGVASFFDEDQFVSLMRRHVIIQVAEELRKISIGKIIIGSYKQSAGVSDLLSL